MWDFWDELKVYWLFMLEPPWRDFDPDNKGEHWLIWTMGWVWSVAGLVLGAFLAPLLLARAGLGNVPYHDALAIGFAVVTGFVVQVVGWSLLLLWAFLADRLPSPLDWFNVPLLFAGAALPLLGVGYGLYRYFAWVGSGQRLVTVAFVGGLLVKTLLIPFIKGLVTGALFRWFIRWLRGDKAKAKSA